MAKSLPADLLQRFSRAQAKRVPHRLTPEDVAGSVVMFRASTRVGRKNESGSLQYTDDGEVVIDEFAPGDDVPEYVMRHYDFSAFVKQGRIYVRPWPSSTNKTALPAWDYKSNKSAAVEAPKEEEAAVVVEPGFSLRELKGLTDKASIKNLRNAFDKAGIEYSQAASKSELHALRRESLGIAEEAAPDVEVENG